SYKVRATKDGKPVKLDQDLITITKGDKQIVHVRLEGEASPAVAVTPNDQRGAFVLLGGKGEAGRFDTLADAVQRASDGDTIEIRGTGPFVTPPLAIPDIPLTFGAGTGYLHTIGLTCTA